MKNKKPAYALSLLITAAPALAGALLWNRLPSAIASHWGAGGADGYSGKGFVLILPAVFVALDALCIYILNRDPGNGDQSGRVKGFMLWLVPALSVCICGVVLAQALGAGKLSPDSFVFILLGTLFAVLGNFMPKIRRNSTFGIKVKWTLENEENWNATHRFGGKVWFFAGLALILLSLVTGKGADAGLIACFALIVLAPVVYSYLYYRKQKRSDAGYEKLERTIPSGRKLSMMILLPLFLIVVPVLLFTGSVHFTTDGDSLRVSTTFTRAVDVSFDLIDSIEYREDVEVGARTNGFGSMRLLAGEFENGEFGAYVRYSYKKPAPCVVLDVAGDTLVIGAKDAEATRNMYEALMAGVEKYREYVEY